MAWRELIFSAIFLCIISAKTLASDERNVEHVLDLINPFGVTHIKYYKDGVICSGCHLSTSVILTTAECVYGRTMEKLAVRVKTQGAPLFAGVWNVTIHPLYKPNKTEHNFAFLLIYTKPDWTVEKFNLRHNFLPAEEIIEKGIVTNLIEWRYTELNQEFNATKVNSSVTTDFNVCGLLTEAKGWYCVPGIEDDYTYSKMDVGMPFYYESDNDKILLGLYTGTTMTMKASGHLYVGTFSIFPFLKQLLNEHPPENGRK